MWTHLYARLRSPQSQIGPRGVEPMNVTTVSVGRLRQPRRDRHRFHAPVKVCGEQNHQPKHDTGVGDARKQPRPHPPLRQPGRYAVQTQVRLTRLAQLSASNTSTVTVRAEIRLFAHLEPSKWAKSLISRCDRRDPACQAGEIRPFWRAGSGWQGVPDHGDQPDDVIVEWSRIVHLEAGFRGLVDDFCPLNEPDTQDVPDDWPGQLVDSTINLAAD